jgi:hypothetical protein
MSKINFLGSKEFKLIDLAHVIPNYLNIEECNNLINVFLKNKHLADKELYVDTNDTTLNESGNVLVLDPFSTHAKFLSKCVCDIIKKYEIYLKQHNMFYTLNISSFYNYVHAYRLLEYETSNFIKPHSDFGIGHMASCIINLNNNYSGGELVFFNGQYKVNLDVGDAIIFPADLFWLHEIKPVTEGKRYSFNSFICDIPKNYLGSPYCVNSKVNHQSDIVDEPKNLMYN